MLSQHPTDHPVVGLLIQAGPRRQKNFLLDSKVSPLVPVPEREKRRSRSSRADSLSHPLGGTQSLMVISREH
jgi:hypothetical protein